MSDISDVQRAVRRPRTDPDPAAAWRALAADAGHPLAGVPNLELAAGVATLLAAVRLHQEARRGAH